MCSICEGGQSQILCGQPVFPSSISSLVLRSSVTQSVHFKAQKSRLTIRSRSVGCNGNRLQKEHLGFAVSSGRKGPRVATRAQAGIAWRGTHMVRGDCGGVDSGVAGHSWPAWRLCKALAPWLPPGSIMPALDYLPPPTPGGKAQAEPARSHSGKAQSSPMVGKHGHEVARTSDAASSQKLCLFHDMLRHLTLSSSLVPRVVAESTLSLHWSSPVRSFSADWFGPLASQQLVSNFTWTVLPGGPSLGAASLCRSDAAGVWSARAFHIAVTFCGMHVF